MYTLHVRTAVLVIGTFLVLCLAAPAGAHTTGAAHDHSASPARGVTFAELVQATAARCRGLFAGRRSGECTHGPDEAPAHVDVRQSRSTTALADDAARRRAAAGGLPTTAGATIGTAVAPTDGSGAIVCDGDGVSGKRVQVLYVVAADRSDRFAALVDTLGAYTVAADGQYNASALETGGARHVRFMTTPDGLGGCALDIRKVVVSSTGDDTFDATVSAVKAAGYNQAGRKYLMYVDANVYCGIGSIYRDDSFAQTNLNNGSYPQYGRADAGCWGYAEAHELMHNLGGVQPTAPDATPGFHCNDEYDEMCYDDDGSGPVSMSYTCSSAHATRFDCDHDSYFHTAPPSTSWLATHWNTANSSFLIAAEGTQPPPPPDPTTVTASLAGKFTKWSTSATLTRTALAGVSSARASGKAGRRPAPVTLTLRNAAGTALATVTGTDVTLPYTLPADGSYRWTVSGASGVSYTLQIGYLN